MSIRDDFSDTFASTAFQRIDGEWALVGKIVRITQDTDAYDVWFIGEGMEPLSHKKLRALEEQISAIEHCVALDGEIVVQVRDRESVLALAELGGVKKRRQISPEERDRRKRTLEQVRNGRISEKS